jgi:hypothetical protein
MDMMTRSITAESDKPGFKIGSMQFQNRKNDARTLTTSMFIVGQSQWAVLLDMMTSHPLQSQQACLREDHS